MGSALAIGVGEKFESDVLKMAPTVGPREFLGITLKGMVCSSGPQQQNTLFKIFPLNKPWPKQIVQGRFAKSSATLQHLSSVALEGLCTKVDGTYRNVEVISPRGTAYSYSEAFY